MSKSNKNRPGYKKTKVGWIPEEWGCNTLKSMCLNSGEYGACATANPYSKEHIRYIRITDITDDGKLSDEKLKSIDCVAAENYLLKNGDFLFARTGATVGKTYFHNKNDKAKYAYAGYLIKFVPDPRKILGCYLRLYTSTYKYWDWIKLNTRSGAQPNINATEYGSLLIPTPPPSEQQKITEILSAWDLAIEQTKKLIEAKQKLKKGLMQQLLTGRMRFPEFGKPIKNKGELPDGWLVKKLAYYFNERNETAPDLPLLSITADRGVISREDVLRKDTSNADKSKYKKIMPGDVGYNTMRMWQGVSAVSSLEGIVSPAYTICMQTENSHACFFGHLFKFPPIINLFHRYSQGLVDDTLNLKFHHFAQIKLLVPNKIEQIKIASIFTTIDKEVDVLSKHEVVLQRQKKV